MKSKYNLENTEFKPIYLFFKFGPKDRLEQLQKNGYVYMKRLKYFVDLEKETLIKGQGDRLEARLFHATSIRILDPYTNNILLEAGDTTISDANELKKPVFCIASLNIFDNITKFEYPKFESKIVFSPKMTNDFSGDNEAYVLVISDVQQFLSRIKSELDNLKLTYKYGMVKYRDTRYIYKDNDVIEFNTAFHKDTYFKYQNEFRLLINTEIEDYFDITIGSIADISTLLPAKSVISGLSLEGNTGEPEVLGKNR